MPNQPPAPLTFYKAWCFDLSPTCNTWARLTAADVHALKEREGFEGQTPSVYFHLNHPIKWVRLVGVVVAFDVFDYRYIMILDDSSGENIEVTCGREKEQSADVKLETQLRKAAKVDSKMGKSAMGNTVDLNGVDVGTVVKVKGTVGSFRGVKQVQLERLTHIRTTNEEVAAWAENTAFRQNVLSKPWVVSDKDERRAKRKADGYEARKKAKEKHKRRLKATKQERRRKEGSQAKKDPQTDDAAEQKPAKRSVRHEQSRQPSQEHKYERHRSRHTDAQQ